MENKIRLPLEMGNRNLLLDKAKIYNNQEKLETFLSDEEKMHSLDFARKVLLANEVQSNNSVEGYYDDIEKIQSVVKSSKRLMNKTEKDKLRILNLYKGYNYILKEKSIGKQTLKDLYKILSAGLLDEYDLNMMGDYYRNAPVYIFHSNNPNVKPIDGLDYNKLEYFMDELFNFINMDFGSNCLTDEFVKSQIIHFYFVYIHPYFDINGRTSRTMSIWHLLNKEAYPFVIFNRGIQLNKQEYYKVIMDVRKFSNISFFVDYMMKTVLVELQKEHVMQNIGKEVKDLTALDYQTMHYLLSMKGLLTLCDFTNVYNRYNDKKIAKTIYHEMIEPLMDKGILLKGRETKKMYGNDNHNFIMNFNSKYIDDDPTKTGELKVLL